ncbi:MAG TPA: hypothetical protein VGB62_10530 [Allosphingosinicella sp.]
MRKLIIAAALLGAAAAPAAAQSYPDGRYDPRDEEIVRALPHPGEIEAMGDTLGRVADAIMDVDVGPIRDAVDPEARRYGRRHRETLGDIASRDDPYARDRIRDQIGAATVGVGAASRELAVLTPVLRRSLEDATRRMEDAMRGRGYDRRYDDRDYEDRDYDYDRRD